MSKKLSDSAVIVIVIVCCLAFISMGAALTRQLYPPSESGTRYEPTRDQEAYMRMVRMRNRYNFHRQSLMPKDLEANYTEEESSRM